MNMLQKKEWNVNQNFSLLRLYKENHVNDTAESSLFHGTIIEQNDWENVKIDNSDLEAIRILHSTIKNTSFKNADIHSIFAVNTEFYNVSFENTDITDCTFSNCKFIKCNFSGAALKESVFENCILEEPLFMNGSYIMNTFKNCVFQRTCFKNVFYYTHFDECVFEGVVLEAYLLGYIYGLSITNLESLTFLFMGEACDYTYQEVCSKIEDVYKNRKMIINLGILYLLDPQLIPANAILKCFECVNKYIENDCLVQNEQMIFLNKIITIMYCKEQISPLVLVYLLNIINAILNSKENVALEKAKTGLTSIKNSILTHYHAFADELTERLSCYPKNGETMLKIIYEKEPTYRLTDIINEIDSTKEITVVKTEIGSFVEWIKCVAEVLPYIDTFLALLGVVVPIVVTKVNKKKQTDNKQVPNKDCVVEINNNIDISQLSKKQTQILPEIIKNSIDPVLQNNINRTVKFVLNNNFVAVDDKHGYTTQNLRSIEVKYQSEH